MILIFRDEERGPEPVESGSSGSSCLYHNRKTRSRSGGEPPIPGTRWRGSDGPRLALGDVPVQPIGRRQPAPWSTKLVLAESRHRWRGGTPASKAFSWVLLGPPGGGGDAINH